MRVQTIIMISISLVALATSSAFGRYSLKGDPNIAAWFHALMNPTTKLSCCDESDGHILSNAEWRTVGDRYQVMIQGSWVFVPQKAVLSRIPNPTGSAVVFYDPETTHIYCFVRAPEV